MSNELGELLAKIEINRVNGLLSDGVANGLTEHIQIMLDVVKKNPAPPVNFSTLLTTYIDAICYCQNHPISFNPIHLSVREPIDFYQSMIDLFKPFIDMENSTLDQESESHLAEIESAIDRGENVILMANHQSELDPQLMSILLEKNYADLAEKIYFVAGERVIKDPCAIPFSLGRNLICIYSKRYISDDDIEKREHNQIVTHKIAELLKQGSKCIYVALSGGRDRKNPLTGEYEVAKPDPKSAQMFSLLAKRSGSVTHFYPLILKTYAILPPPEKVEKKLGEKRSLGYDAIHIRIGEKIDFSLLGADWEERAENLHTILSKTYATLPKLNS